MAALPARIEQNNWLRFGPYLVAVPVQMVIFGLYGRLIPFGVAGVVGLALFGLLWALLLGYAATWAVRRWGEWFANGSLLLAIMITGIMFGGALMYIPMMALALDEPSTTYAVLSALMQPAVPFYIILNSTLEMALVVLLLFANWGAAPRRRWFVIAGVLLYFIMRIWTYFVYAELRLDISQRLLSDTDVEWFRQTLVVDYRPILVVLAHICFVLAAFVPVTSQKEAKQIEPAGHMSSAGA
jgi:hypothetical protein